MASQAAQQETDRILNLLLAFAKRMLEEGGEFFPFGAALSSSGKLVTVPVEPTDANPPSQAIVDDLSEAFRTGARKGTFRATGMAINVITIPPGESANTDAVEVCLDHVSGYSVRVIVPYRLEARVVTFGTPFATPGADDVFGELVH